MTTTITWVKRWRDTIAAAPELPGVWRRMDGGFHVRGRATDPRTGKLREVNRVLADCKRARDAALELASDLAKIRDGAAIAPATMPRFAEWAVTVLERKIASGKIVAASGRETWDWALRVHLIPAFGELYVGKLTREDVERWKEEMLAPRTHTKDEKRARELTGGKYKPKTVNALLEILRQITGAAADAFHIADPCRNLEKISKRGHRTYTYEEPNALKPEHMPKFLDEFRESFPEYYAFVFLGFTTGLRPSSLRPLRWRGPNADVKWDDGVLLVRRSHTHKSEVMDATKTDRDQMLALDERQLEVLRWHVDRLELENSKRAERAPKLAAAMADSELLFPALPTRWSNGGGFRSRSSLNRAFREVADALELGYSITPRAMRRTYQDLARAANVPDIVTRAISGHSTPEMQRHYSTVSAVEMRTAMSNVIDLATARAKRAA